MSTAVLSQYPFSQGFRKKLEDYLADPPTYLSVSELRDLPLLQIWARLRLVRCERLLIPIEDEHALAVLPFLKLIAGATAARKIEVIGADLSRFVITRWALPADLAGVAKASVIGRVAAANARKSIRALLALPRIPLNPPNSHNVFYLNANLWFGLKAGGSIGHVAGVANALVDRGYEVTYASVGENPMLSPRINCVGLTPPKRFGFPWEYTHYVFDRLVTEQAASLISGSYAFIYQRLSLGNFTGVKLSRDFRVPYVLEYNGSEAWAAKNWGRPLNDHELAVRAEDACLKHAHVVVTISEVLKEELISRGVEKKRIVFYPNCVNETVFNPSRFARDERARLRARYGIPHDGLVIGFVGTFGVWHGVEVLAQAMKRLTGDAPEWLKKHKVHFLLIGDGPKMPLVKQILGRENSPFWTLAGLIPQPETPLHLAATDILMSPHVPNKDGSRFFGSPTKLFEYMAMGKAIVASDLDQIGEVLKNSLRASDLPASECVGSESEVAVLCRPADVDELMQGIRFVVEHPGWRSRLGLNARDEVLGKYTWSTHVAKILQALERVQEVTA